jgi:hypothetical protein
MGGREATQVAPANRVRRWTLVACAALAVAVPLIAAAPAPAVQSDIYDPVVDCPTDHPLMNDPVFGFTGVGCVGSLTNAGTFRIKSTTTTVTHPVHAQFGYGSPEQPAYPDCASCFPTVPAPPGKGLQANREVVPGGLIPLVGEDLLRLVLGQVPEQLTVFAKVQLAGKIERFNLGAALGAPGPAFTLPVKVKLINPALGNNCYIGSNNDPIVLKPSFTQLPTPRFVPEPNGLPVGIATAFDGVLRDNTFAVPRARNCGPLGLLTPGINLKVGLPSASGQNEAVFSDVDTTIASAQPPGLGAAIRAAINAAQ